MAMTVEQYWEILQNKIRKFVLRILREEGVYNELMWPNGKIDTVSADGKTADVFINGATTSTKAIPIVNGLKVMTGDEVIVLNRAKMRDLVIMYGKSTSSLSNQAWIAPTLLNGWVNYGGTDATAGYYKDSIGNVHIKGVLKSGNINSTFVIFNLPVGYRPLEDLRYSVINYNGTSYVTAVLIIKANGDIIVAVAPSNNMLVLNDIPTFKSEQ